MNKRNKKTVLITGGARRIGAATAMHLASEGWSVVTHCNRSEDEAAKLCRRIADQYGVAAFTVCGDLSNPAEVDRVFKSATNTAGQIDALINNAAIFSAQPSETFTPEDYARFSQINALAPIQLTHHFAQHIKERNAHGSVINILDQRISDPQAKSTPYLESKRALAAFTVDAADKLAPHIRVNAVAPGAILLPENRDGKEPAGMFSLDYKPTPQDVSKAISYLLTAESVTGQTIFIDSGQHLQ